MSKFGLRDDAFDTIYVQRLRPAPGGAGLDLVRAREHLPHCNWTAGQFSGNFYTMPSGVGGESLGTLPDLSLNWKAFLLMP